MDELLVNPSGDAVIYKDWTPIVYLRQDGRWWFIVRRVMHRGHEMDDVLEVAVDRERIEGELRRRGYRPVPGENRAAWTRQESPHFGTAST